MEDSKLSSMTSDFPSDRRQRVSLDGKVRASVDIISEMASVYLFMTCFYVVHFRALLHCWKPYCRLCIYSHS